ncbi:hypothetical protein DET49_11453 [Salegentibacter sp. 24]|uniref:hypothetical protein n=1 Tax=Salegentibacter sp. 24 TaxID=2183986 RepID=UPI0010EF312B|nr:hypothetical protein [Salegentibacter sp. 24]TDN87099.1 hypothetical protein DET49_11453 [Salegentibacter sp. 24]
MKLDQKIFELNNVLRGYFKKKPRKTKVPAKDLMPEFIKHGIFPKDHRNGLPIRKLLRDLDKNNELNAIPFAFAERGDTNTNWFFVRSSKSLDGQSFSKPAKIPKTKSSKPAKQNSDESYVIDLCDEILGQKASRQHKFDFLKGDSGRRLPVDAFYEKLNLAIEYRERQHSEAVSHFDKPHKITVSGVHRGEQRKIYDQRRRDLLPKNGIHLIEIDYNQFEYDGRKRIVRDRERDLEVVNQLISKQRIKF